MMSYHPVEYKSNMCSLVYSNEYSKTKNSTDSSNCFNFERHSEFTVEESTIEYSNVKGLIDNQVSKTRLENNPDNKDRLLDNQNKMRLESNHEMLGYPSILKYIFVGGIDMVKRIIDIDPETDKIINRLARLGEKRKDVIKRAFSYLDKDSNFWNQE